MLLLILESSKMSSLMDQAKFVEGFSQFQLNGISFLPSQFVVCRANGETK